MEFKIGDRVRVVDVSTIENPNIKVGFTGTVLEVSNKACPILVEFDESFSRGHDGHRSGKNGHCWYMISNEIETRRVSPRYHWPYYSGE